MKTIYNGVPKDKRKVFKHFMDWDGAKYTFKGDKATVTYYEDYINYIVTNDSIQKKNDFKRAMQQGIIEFKNYCFNN